jgi:hypothetical protein
MMGSAGQGIVRDQKGEEQPQDKDRAQTAHKSKDENAVSREATRNSGKRDAGRTEK